MNKNTPRSNILQKHWIDLNYSRKKPLTIKMSLIDKLQEQEPIPLADDDPQGMISKKCWFVKS